MDAFITAHIIVPKWHYKIENKPREKRSNEYAHSKYRPAMKLCSSELGSELAKNSTFSKPH